LVNLEIDLRTVKHHLRNPEHSEWKKVTEFKHLR